MRCCQECCQYSPELDAAPAMDLDLRVVGDRLMRFVALSAMLGHTEPAHTLAYVHITDGSEGEFVRDVISGMRTSALADKWFGGMDGLVHLAGAFLNADELLAAATS